LLTGKTEKEITLNHNQSQLELLKNFRLLNYENEVWKANFPILGETQTLELRGKAKEVAAKLGSLVEENVVSLLTSLNDLNREKNAYTILFSYVLDELVWRRFSELGYMQERSITAENPFWSGVIWAVYPPRDFACGTNKISDKGISLNVNWTEKAIKNMYPFVSDWKNLLTMFDDYAKFGAVRNTDARKVFDKFNLYDYSGKFTVPIIFESKENALFERCSVISNGMGSGMFNFFDLNELTHKFGFSSNEEALVVFYHELMWEMLDYYEKNGVIKKPIAFSNPDETLPEDISDLVFIIRAQ
jgi:hypothetical protein